ncbi:MAG: hypothetical protein QNJ60_15035 [Xenococcaceae cyanobacterium MO_188.B19]|nr:hypothetical protein [Xenococcaceae cyanobacterium MO_188.B19]
MNRITPLFLTSGDINFSLDLVRYCYLKKVADHDTPDDALKLLSLIFQFEQKIPKYDRLHIEYKIYNISQIPLQDTAIFYNQYLILEETRILLKNLIEKADGFWYYKDFDWHFISLTEWEQKWQNYRQLSRISDSIAYVVKAAKHGEFNSKQ